MGELGAATRSAAARPAASPRDRLAFVAAPGREAQQAAEALKAHCEHVEPESAEVIVAVGGDGFMLQTLHDFIDRGVPIFGLNRGSIGFLMNEYTVDGLPERVASAAEVTLHPLRMRATTVTGATQEAVAINDVSLLRQTHQTAKIQIAVDEVTRMAELVCDGVLIATPAGSTAYNSSVYGPIIPLGAELLAMTAISAFRPRRWRGALLRHDAVVDFRILDADKRPVSSTADSLEVRDVVNVRVTEDRSIDLKLLFDPEHNLEERILVEQFTP